MKYFLSPLLACSLLAITGAADAQTTCTVYCPDGSRPNVDCNTTSDPCAASGAAGSPGNSPAAAAPGHQGDSIIVNSLSAGLSGQISGADAMGGVGVGLLLNMLFTPGDNGQAAAEAERRRQALLEQQRLAEAARRAAEEAKQRKFNADKADLTGQLRGGAGELDIKGSVSDLSLKDIQIPETQAGTFNDYRDWEARKREVLAFQEKLTQGDPGNKVVETWCKLHLPLSQATDERYGWECRCYRCPAATPMRLAQAPAQSAQDRVMVGGMALKEVDAQLAQQAHPGQQSFAARNELIVERSRIPAETGGANPAPAGVAVAAPVAPASDSGSRAPADSSRITPVHQDVPLPVPEKVDLQGGAIEQIRAAGAAGFENRQPLSVPADARIPERPRVPVQEAKLAPGVRPENPHEPVDTARPSVTSRPPQDGIQVGNTRVSPMPAPDIPPGRAQRRNIDVPLPEIAGWSAEARGGAEALDYVSAQETRLAGVANSEVARLQLDRIRRNAEMMDYYDRILNATRLKRIDGMRELDELLQKAGEKKLAMAQDAALTISDVTRATRKIQLILKQTDEARAGVESLNLADDVNKITEAVQLLDLEYQAMKSHEYNREYWSEVAPKLTALAAEIQKLNRLAAGASPAVAELMASKAALLATVSYSLAKLANGTLDVVMLEVMTDDVNITMGNQSRALADVQKNRKKFVDGYLSERRKFEALNSSIPENGK